MLDLHPDSARAHATAALVHTGALIAITGQAAARAVGREAAWTRESRRNAGHAVAVVGAAALALWAVTRPVAVDAGASWQSIAAAATRCQKQGQTLGADADGRLTCVELAAGAGVALQSAPPDTAPAFAAPVGPQEPSSASLPAWMPPTVTRYGPQITAAATRHGIDAALLAIVVLVESGGNPRAVSGSGAQGLAQVMPATAAGIGAECVAQPFDAATSIDCGARYLSTQLRAFGAAGDADWQQSVERAAAAYNGGPGSVQRWLSGGSLPAEAERYKRWVGGMWAERQMADSSTFRAWMDAGGYRLVQAAGSVE